MCHATHFRFGRALLCVQTDATLLNTACHTANALNVLVVSISCTLFRSADFCFDQEEWTYLLRFLFAVVSVAIPFALYYYFANSQLNFHSFTVDLHAITLGVSERVCANATNKNKQKIHDTTQRRAARKRHRRE